ncbi:formate dehydrogenase subunit alpha [Marinobacter zhejiangensis]|uniref:Formate dehydrogenase major subunit n=1 Tax=Marinobacter zhejiangensis TaxID=488535 RepID=A0A1I4Q8H4_9GAMM|nr:formate dehydrogenase subunit alpha [Marinobacter zhejiangensis]SFM35933.1 formate dehydrogenase major subunit [Marinobacter zhejiangensis]
MPGKQAVQTICPFCGVGCGMHLLVDDQNRVAAVSPQGDHPISRGKLCAKGWSTPFAIEPGDRIRQPLIRTDDGFRPASWDEALEVIRYGLLDILSQLGPTAVGVISSARASNEDNYAAQKFARAVLGTNNIDHCARICHSPTVAGLKQTLGSGAMTNSAADIDSAEVLVVWGADATENHAILGGHIIEAKLRGATLIVVDPRRTRLAKLADLHLQVKPGTNILLVNALLHEIFRHGWQNQDFLDSRCEGADALRKSVRDTSPTQLADAIGVPAEQIEAMARTYGQANSAMILYGMGITQFVSGTFNVMALSNLALSCGQIGRPGTGINPLRGQNNVQGACDMGCLPNVYPGYQDVADPAVRQHVSDYWQCPLPDHTGLTSMGMTQAALRGEFKGLILFGEDPVVTDPDQNEVLASLKALDLLVVAELTMTETARHAHVVLPAASFAEKNGTFTNCERRVQRIHQAIPPVGEALGDWQWLGAIARQLGSSSLDWTNSQAVFDEMAGMTPSYSGMSYEKLARQHGLQWPCDDAAPEGTPTLHQTEFPIGRARLIPVHHVDIDEPADADYPLQLTTNRLHFHYGCGSMSRKSPLLERETPDGILFISPEDARNLRLKNHSAIGIRSRRGYLETRAIITDDLPPGLVSMPYHFSEAPSNQLTNRAMDPVSKMPELKVCAVRITPLPEGQAPRTIQSIRASAAPPSARENS